MSLPSQEEIKSFYNQYVPSQKKIGVNIRHRTILKKAKDLGLNANSTVLEIGCGIGTFTSLLCKTVTQGKIVATDISSNSVKTAQENLKASKNLSCVVTDMSDFKTDTLFDFFILPDVIEHIPIDQHQNLFEVFEKHSHDKSKILIHVPHPTFIEWLSIHHPKLMQIIDQAIHSDELCKNAYQSGWILESLNSYGLYHELPDYQFIVFKRNIPYSSVPKKNKWLMKKEDLQAKLY